MISSKTYVLAYEEVYYRLDEVLANVIEIHARGNFPTLQVQPIKFIKMFTARLKNQQEFDITDYRLNGKGKFPSDSVALLAS